MKHFFLVTSSVVCLIAVTVIFSGCQVIRGERGLGEYSSDATITSKVKGALMMSDELSALRVTVETDRGTVLLSGVVRNEHQKKVAGEIARKTGGVKLVKNDLIIQP